MRERDKEGEMKKEERESDGGRKCARERRRERGIKN